MGLKHKAHNVFKKRCKQCGKRKVYNPLTWVTVSLNGHDGSYSASHICGECMKLSKSA